MKRVTTSIAVVMCAMFISPVEGDAQRIASQVVMISARPDGFWNNSGVYVSKGDKIKIKYVDGMWKSNPHWQPADAAGDARYLAGPSYLLPGQPEGAVVMKISGGNGAEKAQYYVGNMASIVADKDGLIWLTVNDEPAGFGDNIGTMRMMVSVE
jgi:hypothetical protein